MQAAGAALYFLGAYKLNWAPIVVANDSEKFWGNFIVPNGTEILRCLTSRSVIQFKFNWMLIY
jgi:hypothetical protein